MRNSGLYKIITCAVTVEVISIMVLTLLFTSDFLTNKEYLESGFVLHRVGLLAACYFVAAFQSGYSFYTRMVRPEKILITTFKTVIYMLFLVGVIMLCTNEMAEHNKWVIWLMPSIFVVMSGERLLFRAWLRSNRRKGRDSNVACLIGCYENLQDVLQTLCDDASGYSVLGYYNETPDASYPEEIKYMGTVSDFISFASDYKCPVESVFFASQLDNLQYIKDVYSICDNHLMYFYCMPIVHSEIKQSIHVMRIGSTSLIVPRELPLQRATSRIGKRIFDICFSAFFLLTLFPVVLIIFGIWIKLSSRGPLFFCQKRTGMDNKEFKMYKFRSMKVNEDADIRQATKDDDRVTFVGKLMRRTSIDELPQFINVFLGDMSVVGPRPHMVKHTTMYRGVIDKYMVRHFVKPGVTGWAQVNGYRGETHELWQMEGRVKRDIWYIENWSFFLDLVIIYKTVVNMFKGEAEAY